MENLRSKRRPVQHRDEVDESIDNLRQKIKYNPVRRFFLNWIILFGIIYFVWSWLGPTWQQGGPSGLANTIVQIALQLAFAAMFAFFQIYIMFFAISRPRTYWLKPGETGISFQDYKGNPQVLEMAREVVLLLKGTKEFKNMGGEVIRGLLLEGDPGVGKSYLAQAIATEAGLPFGYCSAASLQSPFVAGGMLSIRSLYKKAGKFADQYGACILFLDEIDAIGQARNGMNGGGGMAMGMGGMMGAGAGLINELLVQMDPPPVLDSIKLKMLRWLGIDLSKKKAVRRAVLTIGATNIVSTLDPALLRPGRFDRKITVDLPDGDGRREIIEYYLDKVNHENIPVDKLVGQTIGYTPVAIRYVINEAVVRAHFDGRDAITYKDFIAARDLHEVGLKMPIRGMSKEEQIRIAYHETGHAVAQILLSPNDDLVKLTIIRHGDALGFMQPKPKEERYTMTKDEMEADMMVSLASRAAEELFLKTQMTGFSGDLASATRRAVVYCNVVGMNGHFSSSSVLGESTVSVVEVETLLQTLYRRVKALLEANSELCHEIARELVERKEMLGDEVMEIVNRYNVVMPTESKTLGFKLTGGGKPHKVNAYSPNGYLEKARATGTDGGSSADGDEGVVYPGAVAYRPETITSQSAPAPKPQAVSDEDDLLPKGW